MKTTINTTVRKDGAINLKVKGRRALGITSGMSLQITVEDGIASVKPNGYYCFNCEKYSEEPLNELGICRDCNRLATDVLRNSKTYDLVDALKTAANMRHKAQSGKKV